MRKIKKKKKKKKKPQKNQVPEIAALGCQDLNPAGRSSLHEVITFLLVCAGHYYYKSAVVGEEIQDDFRLICLILETMTLQREYNSMCFPAATADHCNTPEPCTCWQGQGLGNSGASTEYLTRSAYFTLLQLTDCGSSHDGHGHLSAGRGISSTISDHSYSLHCPIPSMAVSSSLASCRHEARTRRRVPPLSLPLPPARVRSQPTLPHLPWRICSNPSSPSKSVFSAPPGWPSVISANMSSLNSLLVAPPRNLPS